MFKTKYEYTLSDVESIRMMMMQNRDPYLPYWRTQAQFISPKRFIESIPGRRNQNAYARAREIFDNTAGRANRTFVAGMMNGSTSRVTPWWTLEPLDIQLKTTQTDTYISQLVGSLNQTFQISNLYEVLPMSYKDIGIFSNSAFAMLPHKTKVFYFKTFAVGTYAIATDSEGMVNMFVRDFTLTVRQLVEDYGQIGPNGHIDWSNFDPWVQQHYEAGQYLTEVQLSNLIIPNPTPVPDSLMPKYSMQYQSYTWVRGMGTPQSGMLGNGFRYSNQPQFKESRFSEKKNCFISIKGYDYFPIIANRWEVAAEGDWGVDGPGDMAIQEIQTLQEEEKYRLEGAAKLVKPPMVAPASMKRHQASILAGGITYIDELSEGTKFRQAFEVNPQLAELIASQGEYRQAIKESFFVDLFLMMSSQQPLSHVTAEEIKEKAAEKLVGIGPALGQLDQDQNARLIRNGIHLLAKTKKMPQIPRSLQGQEFRPEYISILAQASKASQVASGDQLLNTIANIAKITGDQTITKILKAPEFIRQRADFLGVDPSMLQDEEGYNGIVDAYNQQQAQQAQVEQMNKASQTAKNLSGAQISDDNMLGRMQQQAQAGQPQ